jgi:hypothetical protein
MDACRHPDNLRRKRADSVQRDRHHGARPVAGFEWGGDWTTRKDYQHFEVVE